MYYINVSIYLHNVRTGSDSHVVKQFICKGRNTECACILSSPALVFWKNIILWYASFPSVVDSDTTDLMGRDHGTNWDKHRLFTPKCIPEY
jgi:hypothetical protein